MIGAFLIDFFAHGSWGSVEIFIPLFLAVAIKRILQSLIPVEIEEAAIWSSVEVDLYAKLEEVEKLNTALKKAEEEKNKAAIEAIQNQIKSEILNINRFIAVIKNLGIDTKSKALLLGVLEGRRAELEGLLQKG